MKYNPNIHNRKSIRLKEYDYSQAGLYFITLCIKNYKHLFGEIIDDKMILNDAGKMVESEWVKLKKRFKNIELHEYVVMPNHFHAILEITVGATLVVAQDNVDTHNNALIRKYKHRDNPCGYPIDGGNHKEGQPQGIAPTDKTIGDMIAAFKSITTVEYTRGVKNNNWQQFNKKLWQRNYWEHIIRNDDEYHHINKYISDNPQKWATDRLNE